MKLFISCVGLLISEFRWIIILDSALSGFPRPRSLQMEEKWEESRKDGMILQNQRNSSDRHIMLGLVLGDGKERQGQFLAQTLWAGRHGPCNKVRSPFVFPISKRNKNSGFSHVESGNPDTPRFVLKNRDILIKSGWVAGLHCWFFMDFFHTGLNPLRFISLRLHPVSLSLCLFLQLQLTSAIFVVQRIFLWSLGKSRQTIMKELSVRESFSENLSHK